MKKVITFLLALLMCLSLLAGCGGGNGTSGGSGSPAGSGGTGGSTGGGDAVKVVMGMISFNNIPEDVSPVEDTINQYIRETYPDANVELVLKLFGPAEYANKMNLMMQGGEQLDIFIPLNYSVALANSQLAPLTEHLQSYGQEMMEIVKQGCGDDIFDVVTSDGEIMAIPVNKNMILTPTVQLDLTMLNETGFSTDDITDLRSLEPIFDVIKEMYPDIYPYVSTDVANQNLPHLYTNDNRVDRLGTQNSYGVAIGDDSTVVNLYETDIFRDVCLLMKEWYDKGYMPKDMATSTMRGMDYLLAQRAFSTFASYGGKGEMGDMLTVTYGRPMYAQHIAKSYFTTDSVSVSMGVPSTSKDPAAAVRFLNILYTDEFVVNTLLWGREGVDYVKMDDRTVAFPEGKTAETVSYCQYLCSGVMGTEYMMWGLFTGELFTDEEYAENLDYALRANREADRSPFFGFRFNADEVKNELAALDNVYDQYIKGLHCGSVDVESTLAAFNSALKDAGLEKVMAVKQEQLNAWIAANS